jgi:hypothetical protein
MKSRRIHGGLQSDQVKVLGYSSLSYDIIIPQVRPSTLRASNSVYTKSLGPTNLFHHHSKFHSTMGLPTQEQGSTASRLQQAPSLPTPNVFFSDPDLTKLNARLQESSISDGTAEILRYYKEAVETQEFLNRRLVSINTILADCCRETAGNANLTIPLLENDSQRSHVDSGRRSIPDKISDSGDGATGASSLDGRLVKDRKRREASAPSDTQDKESLKYWHKADKLITEIIVALHEECKKESLSDADQEIRDEEMNVMETVLLSALWEARRNIRSLVTDVAA